MCLKEFGQINPKLLLIKIHYFFLCGGYGGGLPFGIILGKSLNLNATAIGLLLTSINCLSFLSQPIFGSLVDTYRNIKLFLMSFITVIILFGLSLILIPPIERQEHHLDANATCIKETTFYAHNHRNFSDDAQQVNYNTTNELKNATGTFSIDGSKLVLPQSSNETELKFNDLRSLTSNFAFQNYSLDNIQANLTKTSSEEPINYTRGQENSVNSINVWNAYQFWVYALVLILVFVSSENASSLTDVACYEILGNKRHLYGSQRLFGTIGWAAVCALSGYLNDISSAKKARKDYSTGLYIMGALLTIDLFIVSRIPMVKTKVSENVSADLRKVLRSWNIMLFALGTTAIGILSTVVSSYEFWYLQDIGASQTLMGAAIVMQCSSEVLFFLIAAWIVSTAGSFNCLVLSFVAFAVRCGSYHLLYNPWWALAIDPLHGITFGVFHFAMTNFASVSAPDGMEATVLGMLSGVTKGLGSAIGNLLAGAALDSVGGRLMFLYFSVFSAVCAVCFVILPNLAKSKNTTDNKSDLSETVENGETVTWTKHDVTN